MKKSSINLSVSLRLGTLGETYLPFIKTFADTELIILSVKNEALPNLAAPQTQRFKFDLETKSASQLNDTRIKCPCDTSEIGAVNVVRLRNCKVRSIKDIKRIHLDLERVS